MRLITHRGAGILRKELRKVSQCVCYQPRAPAQTKMESILLHFKNVRDNLKTEGNFSQGSFFPTAETSRLGRISETGLLTELTKRIISSEKKLPSQSETRSYKEVCSPETSKAERPEERGRKCDIYRT